MVDALQVGTYTFHQKLYSAERERERESKTHGRNGVIVFLQMDENEQAGSSSRDPWEHRRFVSSIDDD